MRRHPETGERRLDALRWGLVPYATNDPAKARKPINARAETVATSGFFRTELAKRRCIVPADAFYEWRAMPDGKQPYAIARTDGHPLAFAGLWEALKSLGREVLRTFAILTTAATATKAAIHDRMPVVLEEADWSTWPGGEDGDPAALLRPAPESVLRRWLVSWRVNSVRNDGADLLKPARIEGPATADAAAGPNPASCLSRTVRAAETNGSLNEAYQPAEAARRWSNGAEARLKTDQSRDGD